MPPEGGWRTRFAPSPTGPLHLGHAYSALIAHDRAQAAGGGFVLRIEDIDSTRCRPEHDAALRDDLAWLGLRWPEPVMRQSGRAAAYGQALARLEALGLCYPCRCTRADIRAALAAPQEGAAPEAPYPGTCRHRPMAEAGPGDAIRLHLDRALGLAGPLPAFRESGPVFGPPPDAGAAAPPRGARADRGQDQGTASRTAVAQRAGAVGPDDRPGAAGGAGSAGGDVPARATGPDHGQAGGRVGGRVGPGAATAAVPAGGAAAHCADRHWRSHRLDPAALVRLHGDVVLRRRDIGIAYHLAVVVDDAAQGITEVVRGADLFEATMLHVLLQRLLGLPVPDYHHHHLVRDGRGVRLAKRDDARALRLYRDQGLTPGDLRQMLALAPGGQPPAPPPWQPGAGPSARPWPPG